MPVDTVFNFKTAMLVDCYASRYTATLIYESVSLCSFAWK